MDSGFRRSDGSTPKPPERKHYPAPRAAFALGGLVIRWGHNTGPYHRGSCAAAKTVAPPGNPTGTPNACPTASRFTASPSRLSPSPSAPIAAWLCAGRRHAIRTAPSGVAAAGELRTDRSSAPAGRAAETGPAPNRLKRNAAALVRLIASHYDSISLP